MPDITVQADGVRLAARIVDGPPDAPTLVLHHGLASTQHIWDLMLPALAERYRVVTFDARGHGRSGKPAGDYGFGTTVADTIAVIRATRSSRPILVGHSWGAMVAIEVAARRPRSLGGIVLVDGGVTRMRESFATWGEAKAALAPPHLTGTPVEDFRAMIPMFFGDAVEVTPEIERIVMAVVRVRADGTIAPRLSRTNHFKILRAVWEQDPAVVHAKIHVPGLAVLAAGSDPEWNARRRAGVRALGASGAPIRVSWMDGIHDLPLQHPAALVRRISAFARTTVG